MTSPTQEERYYRAMKIAIATDTNSGITAMEGEKLGVFVLAMPVNLEETIHYEDKSLFASFFAFAFRSFLFQWVPSLGFQFKLLTIAGDQCTT